MVVTDDYINHYTTLYNIVLPKSRFQLSTMKKQFKMFMARIKHVKKNALKT